MPACWENVGQHDVVILFFFCVFRQFQAIEIRVRDAKVFGLTAVVRSHPCITVGRAAGAGMGGKTEPGEATLAVLTETTGDVEWQANVVADLDGIDRGADFDTLPRFS